MEVRTRFAPSPTGFLHLGGARTALYCWLYARKMKGKFILRVEDTDRERSTEAAIKAIFEGLRWLGLDWDEGPFFQTQRFDRYFEVIQQLLDEGNAYRCYCSKERLEKLREQQMEHKLKPRYDGHCRELNLPHHDQPYVIRFKNPTTGDVVVDDCVYGKIVFHNKELDDLVIRRSDGTPTYNFCVVVDDIDMRITHVLRGDDHVNNTPRQINIFQALNATPPIFAHVPMILGPDGKKLSKREGAVGVMYYREQGILPEAMVNYLVRLGWSAGDQEIFSREEMIKLFDICDLNKSAASLNLEKLSWINQHYIKTLPVEEVAQQLSWQLRHQHVDLSQGPPLTEVVVALKERAKDLREMADKCRFLYQDIEQYNELAAEKFLTKAELSLLKIVYEALQAIETWNKESIHEVIQSVIQQHQLKMAQIAQPLRVALTGDTNSPSIDVTLALMGKEKTLSRIKAAIRYITRGNGLTES